MAMKRAHSPQIESSDDEQIKYGRQLCSTTFFDCKDLYEYMKVHKADREFVCSVCQRTFPHAGNVEQHMMIHLKAYQCIICNGGFTDIRAFKRHLESHIDSGIDVDMEAATEIARNTAKERMEQAKSNLRFECRIYQDRTSEEFDDGNDTHEFKEHILTICGDDNYQMPEPIEKPKCQPFLSPINIEHYSNNSNQSNITDSGQPRTSYSLEHTSTDFEEFVEEFFTIIAND